MKYIGHVLGEEHHHEVLTTPRHGMKGSRELINLECSMNFDARGDCSSQGKGKRVLSVLC